jgi:hypothetical protein
MADLALLIDGEDAGKGGAIWRPSWARLRVACSRRACSYLKRVYLVCVAAARAGGKHSSVPPDQARIVMSQAITSASPRRRVRGVDQSSEQKGARAWPAC